MKHKFLSFIVVIFTVISVGVMVSQNMSNNNLEKDEHIAASQNDGNKKQQVDTAAGNKAGNEGQQSKGQQGVTAGANGSTGGEVDMETDTTAQKDTSVSKENDVSKTPTFNVVKTEEAAYPANAAVFKVEADKILDKMTLVDKGRLLAVAAKISPVDYAKVVNYLNDENYSRGIINVFKLLKMRLSSRDYEELRKVASKYVDVNCIESYIN